MEWRSVANGLLFYWHAAVALQQPAKWINPLLVLLQSIGWLRPRRHSQEVKQRHMPEVDGQVRG